MPRNRRETSLDKQLKQIRLARARAQLKVYCKDHKITVSNNWDLLEAKRELAAALDEHKTEWARSDTAKTRRIARRIRQAAEEEVVADPVPTSIQGALPEPKAEIRNLMWSTARDMRRPLSLCDKDLETEP